LCSDGSRELRYEKNDPEHMLHFRHKTVAHFQPKLTANRVLNHEETEDP
jgi:hypothetical protein